MFENDALVISEVGRIFSQFKMEQLIIAIGLLASRIMGMIWLAPFLGGKLVPAQVKVGISFALGIAVFPYVVNLASLKALFIENASLYPTAFRITGLVLKEVFIGVILGFIILTIWHGAEMIGRFVDTARGSSMGNAVVPESGTQASTLGSLYYQMLLVIFLLLNGHLVFLNYFTSSFILIPIAEIPRFDASMWPLYDLLIKITADLFVAAVTLSAPVMIAIFVTDVCMGLFNKVAPQINVLFLMMPFKAVLGIFFSMVSLLLFIKESEKMMGKTLDNLWLAIRYLMSYP